MKNFLWGIVLSSVFLMGGHALMAAPEPGAGLELSADADKTHCATGEMFNFSVKISGNIQETPKIEVKNFEGFEVLSTGQSQQIQVAQGKSFLTLTLSYVLVPTVPGKRLLGPVEVEYQGQKYKTKPIEITVVQGKALTPTPEDGESSPRSRRRIPNLEGGTIL